LKKNANFLFFLRVKKIRAKKIAKNADFDFFLIPLQKKISQHLLRTDAFRPHIKDAVLHFFEQKKSNFIKNCIFIKFSLKNFIK
jgi:hypothetical protein